MVKNLYMVASPFGSEARHYPAGIDRGYPVKSRKEVRLICPECRRTRIHYIVHVIGKNNYSMDFDKKLESVNYFEFLKCSGCDRGSIFETQVDEGGGTPISDVHFVAEDRVFPNWLANPKIEIAFEVRSVMKEIYEATNNGTLRIAMLGIRSVIESILVEKVGDLGSFKKNLDGLHKLGYVSLVERDSLTDILEAGHAVMHRGHTPELREVSIALDVIEGIISAVYVHPKIAAAIADRVPPRRKIPDTGR